MQVQEQKELGSREMTSDLPCAVIGELQLHLHMTT